MGLYVATFVDQAILTVYCCCYNVW